MHYFNLPIKYNCNIFYFNKYLGLLLSRKETSKDIQEKETIPERVLSDYLLVLQPYKLAVANNLFVNEKVSFAAKIYAKLMVFACKHSFYLASLITNLPFIKFNDTKQALQVFLQLFPNTIQQRTLCLSRTLFVAATSKSFKKSGTAFIGVFLPSRKMHAWIIESNGNPDPFDDMWLLYQPVIAIIK